MMEEEMSTVPITGDEAVGPITRPARKQSLPPRTPTEANSRALHDPMNDPTRSMPWDSDAEKGVLSCFLHDPVNLLNDAELHIPEEAFYHPANQTLYKVMKEFNRGTRPVEYIALSAHLRDTNQIAKIGGPGFLSELLNFVPTPAHYGYYKGILKDKHTLRRIITACTETVADAYAVGELNTAALRALADRAIAGIDGATGQDQEKWLSMAELVNQRKEAYTEQITTGKARGISTGFRDLDRITGGCIGGQTTLIAGSTSDGKSAFALNIGINVADGCGSLEGGYPVGYWLYEMSKEDKMDRLFSMAGRISSTVFLEGMKKEYEQAIIEAGRYLSKLPFWIRNMQGKPLSKLIADIRHGARTKGIKLAIIDYLQLVTPDQDEKTREREVAKASERLTALAENLDIHIIILSQLNDDGKLRESRASGQDANKQLFIEIPHEGRGANIKYHDNRRNIHIKKNRGGQRYKKVQFEFQGEFFRFKELGELLPGVTLV